jgi:hypothetical protein
MHERRHRASTTTRHLPLGWSRAVIEMRVFNSRIRAI